jgi:hypothetical protein
VFDEENCISWRQFYFIHNQKDFVKHAPIIISLIEAHSRLDCLVAGMIEQHAKPVRFRRTIAPGVTL